MTIGDQDRLFHSRFLGCERHGCSLDGKRRSQAFRVIFLVIQGRERSTKESYWYLRYPGSYFEVESPCSRNMRDVIEANNFNDG